MCLCSFGGKKQEIGVGSHPSILTLYLHGVLLEAAGEPGGGPVPGGPGGPGGGPGGPGGPGGGPVGASTTKPCLDHARPWGYEYFNAIYR